MTMEWIGNSGKIPSQPTNLIGGWTNMAPAAPKAAPKSSGSSGVSADAAERRAAGDGLLDPLDAYAQARANIYGEYSYLTGGPNWALINQLTQQRKDAQKRYKTNRADVENMYGQLTTDVQADTEALGKSYDAGMQQSSAAAQANVAGLSGELAAQQERRNRAAAELGISKEALLTDYGSTGRLNEAMGTVLGQNQNWQGLLTAQKNLAVERGNNMQTAVGNTKNQTTTAMKQEYDRVATNINNAIRSEKSRQAVRKLTEEGAMLLGINKTKLKNSLMDQFGLSKTGANKLIDAQRQTNEFFNKYPSVKYQSPETFNGTDPETGKTYSRDEGGWNAMMQEKLLNYYNNSANADKDQPIDPYLELFAKQTGWSKSGVATSYSNVQ